MIIKSIIFIAIAYLVQLNSQNWYNILIFAAIIGLGSNSYKQSIYFSCIVGAIPWLIEFLLKYQNAQLLLNRIAIMLKIQNSILLIVISILLISLLSILVSVSIYYIKNTIFSENK